MAYNQLTQGELLGKRMTARQAVPKNFQLNAPRNLAVVRHSSPPSNDAGLKFDPHQDPVVVPDPDPDGDGSEVEATTDGDESENSFTIPGV